MRAPSLWCATLKHATLKHARPIAVAVTAALTVTLGMAGCTAAPAPAETSTPAPQELDQAALRPFYAQNLEWTPCEEDKQCATASAPLDWNDPAAGSIDLALVRQKATGAKRVGSLFINPGGPGGSGYDLIAKSVDFATSERLQESFDVIGFDPRGVGRSTGIDCYDQPSELDAFIYGIADAPRGSDAWIAEVRAAGKAFGAACLEHTGALLGHIDTVSAARDLDLLRALVGDAKLNYLGYSYGTLLGATFAELYPDRVGRLVLDGALDPAASNTEVNIAQARGFEGALRGFLAACPTYDSCPFTGGVAAAEKRIRALLEALDASPLPNADGRQLGASAMFTAIVLPLYNEENWPYLADLFQTVFDGRADYAFQLADNYYDRAEDGSYQNNSTEAFTAINCLDYPVNADPEVMRAEAAELDAAAPVFGWLMAYGAATCVDWPFAAVGRPGPITAEGSPDILIVGTTGDPATPYQWAQKLAAELVNGHLVTYNGEGHTAYNKSNACVNGAVDAFLVDGTVPAADPNC